METGCRDFLGWINFICLVWLGLSVPCCRGVRSLQPRGGLRPYVCRDVWIMPSLSLDSLLYFTVWVTLQRLLYARSDHVPYFSRIELIHHDPFFPIHGLGRIRGDCIRQVYWVIHLSLRLLVFLSMRFMSIVMVGCRLLSQHACELRVWKSCIPFRKARLLTANGCGLSTHHPFRSSCHHSSSLSFRWFLYEHLSI